MTFGTSADTSASEGVGIHPSLQRTTGISGEPQTSTGKLLGRLISSTNQGQTEEITGAGVHHTICLSPTPSSLLGVQMETLMGSTVFPANPKSSPSQTNKHHLTVSWLMSRNPQVLKLLPWRCSFGVIKHQTAAVFHLFVTHVKTSA